ncbi:hypothetical protein [Ruminococcus sp.]|uniref:hypothetical protein n=1 Tax=Ruminococcus sp. TaxID=41978 RepID=UPI003869A5BC
MTWIIILFIVAVIGIGIAVGVSNAKKTDQMAREGRIIQRQMTFWESAEYFTTTATYEQVKAVVKNNHFSDSYVDIYYNVEGKQAIVFKSNHSWNAELDCLETQGDKNKFKLYFPVWKTHRGMPYDVNSMNALVTSIEKIFLSLDPATTVENRRMEVSTKTKFF